MLSANVLRSQDLFVECKSIIRMLSSFFHKPCNALPTISSNFNLIKYYTNWLTRVWKESLGFLWKPSWIHWKELLKASLEKNYFGWDIFERVRNIQINPQILRKLFCSSVLRDIYQHLFNRSTEHLAYTECIARSYAEVYILAGSWDIHTKL